MQSGYYRPGLVPAISPTYFTWQETQIRPKKDTAMLSTIIAALTRHRNRARAVSILNGFDDNRLRDIGIARDQIELFVAGKI